MTIPCIRLVFEVRIIIEIHRTSGGSGKAGDIEKIAALPQNRNGGIRTGESSFAKASPPAPERPDSRSKESPQAGGPNRRPKQSAQESAMAFHPPSDEAFDGGDRNTSRRQDDGRESMGEESEMHGTEGF